MKDTVRKFCVRLVISIVMVIVGVEVLVRIAAAMGLVQIRTFQVADRADEILFVGDFNPHFGVWHRPNATYTMKTPEGDVTYESNAHGMRDRPREEQSSAAERVVVLGDSFVEGSHVEEAVRFTEVLEAQTGVEFLNFGTSGSFGSIQEMLLYEHLASTFDHSQLLIFLLPDNDFSDNDPDKHPANRYRPYLMEGGDGYEVTYPVEFSTEPPSLAKLSPAKKFRRRMYNRWYSINLVVYRDWKDETAFLRAQTYTPSYDDFNELDLKRLLYTYEQILERAAPRPVTLFVIPRDEDFITHAAGRFEGRIVAELEAFAAQHERLTLVDLMPVFLAYMEEHEVSYKKFFLKTDPHWSELGHRVAAGAVLEALGFGL